MKSKVKIKRKSTVKPRFGSCYLNIKTERSRYTLYTQKKNNAVNTERTNQSRTENKPLNRIMSLKI